MLEQEPKPLAAVDDDFVATKATPEEERRWWLAIVLVLGATLFACWLIGNLL